VVGTEVTLSPAQIRTGPAKAALTSGVCEEAHIRTRTTDAGTRIPPFSVPRKAHPVHPVPLAATPKHAHPNVGHLSAKRGNWKLPRTA
jgi:hypothetical protein